MARMAFLRLEGQRQGEIRGSVMQKGREGRIAVIESNHELSVPLDLVSGQSSGRVEHRPFIVVKEIDQATPRLYQALIDGEVFTEFELQYWAARRTATGAAGSGAEVQRYTVRLTKARLRGIRFVHPDVLDPALKDFPEAEELSFTYERIEWLWVDPASGAGLDWAATRAAQPAAQTRSRGAAPAASGDAAAGEVPPPQRRRGRGAAA